jgi:hypothetical protein
MDIIISYDFISAPAASSIVLLKNTWLPLLHSRIKAARLLHTKANTTNNKQEDVLAWQ